MRWAEYVLYFVLSVGASFLAVGIVRKSWSVHAKRFFRYIVPFLIFLTLSFAYVATGERIEDRLAKGLFCWAFNFQVCKAQVFDEAGRGNAPSCYNNPSFDCIQRGEIVGKLAADISKLSCRRELVYVSSDPILNWKNIWTTSVYSFAPGGGGPGGGLEDDVLKVGGWGDWYYSLIQFDIPNGPFAFGVPQFVALLLYAKTDQLGPVAMFLERIAAPWGGPDNDRLWWKNQPPAIDDQRDLLPAPKQANWYMVDITTLYQDWRRNKFPNYGLRLRPQSNLGTVNFFVSSLASDTVKIPRLLVCW